jgi:hypothetical protein
VIAGGGRRQLDHAPADELVGVDVVVEHVGQRVALPLEREPGVLPTFRGLADLVLTLAGGDSLDRLGIKFPTCEVAVLAWHGHTWRDLEAGAAVLTDLAVPRGMRP